MIVLGLDTATPATAVALRLPDGEIRQARDDPPAGARPAHTAQVLALAHRLLSAAGLRLSHVELVAVGLGPGTFTGLRIGVATARALAQALDAQIAGVSSMQALALPALADTAGNGGHAGVLTVLDARRGEAFMAAYTASREQDAEPPVERAAPQALSPERLPEAIAALPEPAAGPWLAVGDGALLFASELASAGVRVLPADSPLHRVQAAAVCELALMAGGSHRLQDVLPHYGRAPDAELAAARANRPRAEGAANGSKRDAGPASRPSATGGARPGTGSARPRTGGAASQTEAEAVQG